MSNKELFSSRLREIIKNKKIAQDELSSHFEVSVTSISKWVNGNTFPTVDNIIELCRYLNVSCDFLLLGHESESNILSEPQADYKLIKEIDSEIKQQYNVSKLQLEHCTKEKESLARERVSLMELCDQKQLLIDAFRERIEDLKKQIELLEEKSNKK